MKTNGFIRFTGIDNPPKTPDEPCFGNAPFRVPVKLKSSSFSDSEIEFSRTAVVQKGLLRFSLVHSIPSSSGSRPMSYNRFVLNSFILSVTVWGLGCAPGGPALHPVSGIVTGGKGSLEGVRVVLNPADPKALSATGLIKGDGKFSMQSSNGRSGAMPGKYKVTLALGPEAMKKAMEGMSGAGAANPAAATKSGPGPMGAGMTGGPPKIEKPFPEEYSTVETSTKEFEVKAGSNVLDIVL